MRIPSMFGLARNAMRGAISLDQNTAPAADYRVRKHAGGHTLATDIQHNIWNDRPLADPSACERLRQVEVSVAWTLPLAS